MPKGNYERAIHYQAGDKVPVAVFGQRTWQYPVNCSDKLKLTAWVTTDPAKVTCLPCADSLRAKREPLEDSPFDAVEAIKRIADLD